MKPKLLGPLWRQVQKRFAQNNIAGAGLDARVLVGRALGLDPVQLVCNEQQEISPAELEKVEQLVLRRLKGEPVARILGFKEFYGLEFSLNEATLIPRPETEQLVDLGLEFIRSREKPLVVDLGCGSGCIGISMLVNNPDIRVVGVDLSAHALEMARANAVLHGVSERFTTVEGNWFEALEGENHRDLKFDLLVSNPPYIASADLELLEAGVRKFDPLLALGGGRDGLDAYRTIIGQAALWIKNEGCLLLEIGFDQAEQVQGLCRTAQMRNIVVHRDLAGLRRIVSADIQATPVNFADGL